MAIKIHLKGIYYLPVTSDTTVTFLSMPTITLPLHLDITHTKKMLIYRFKLSKSSETVRSTLKMSDNSTFIVFRGFSCQLIVYLWPIVSMFSQTAVRRACFVKLFQANLVPSTEANNRGDYFS